MVENKVHVVGGELFDAFVFRRTPPQKKTKPLFFLLHPINEIPF